MALTLCGQAVLALILLSFAGLATGQSNTRNGQLGSGTTHNATGLKSAEQLTEELSDVSRGRCSPRADLMGGWVSSAQRARSIAPTFYEPYGDEIGLADAMWAILRSDALEARDNPPRFLREQQGNLRISIQLLGQHQGNLRILKEAENLAELIRTDIAECLAGGGKLADPNPGRLLRVRDRHTSAVMGAYVGNTVTSYARIPAHKCFALLNLDGIPIVGSGGTTDIGWKATVVVQNKCDTTLTALLRGRDGSLIEVALKGKESKTITCVRCDAFTYHVSGGESPKPTSGNARVSALPAAESDSCVEATRELNKESEARGQPPPSTPMTRVLQDGLYLIDRYVDIIDRWCQGSRIHMQQKAGFEKTRSSIMQTCRATATQSTDCMPVKGPW